MRVGTNAVDLMNNEEKVGTLGYCRWVVCLCL